MKNKVTKNVSKENDNDSVELNASVTDYFDSKIKAFGTGGGHVIAPGKYVGKDCIVLVISEGDENAKQLFKTVKKIKSLQLNTTGG